MRFARPLFPILPLTGLALLLAIFVPLCKRRSPASPPAVEEPPAPASNLATKKDLISRAGALAPPPRRHPSPPHDIESSTPARTDYCCIKLHLQV